jgi:hypothetical protein
MLYDQLVHINELDSQIADMHKNLADLYSQRAVLLSNGHAATTAPLVKKTSAKRSVALQAKQLYESLAGNWAAIGVKLPAYKLLQRKLETTCRLMRKLESSNDSLKGKLVVAAVPPSKTLVAATQTSQTKFVFSDASIEELLPESKAWAFVVIMDPDFAVPIYGLTSFLRGDEYWYEQTDCRALGVAELIAAELQGVRLADTDSWTVLLRGVEPNQPAVCAIRHDASIIFDLDDTDSLLGANYLHPAIDAA